MLALHALDKAEGRLSVPRAACHQIDIYVGQAYMWYNHIYGRAMIEIDREMKKGSAELLILALVEHEPRHGYELCKLIESRSAGVLTFHAASLYPLLYRLESRGVIAGRWVEKAGQRRRRYYRLTVAGRALLAEQRLNWREFIRAITAIAGVQHA